MNKSLYLPNKNILFETSDKLLKDKIIENFPTSSFSLSYEDLSIFTLKIHLSDLNKCILKEEILLSFEKNEMVKLKDDLKKMEKFSDEEEVDQDDYNLFVNNILINMRVSISGEYGDITNKQLEKIYLSTRKSNSVNFSEPGTGKTIMTLMTHFERERQIGHEIPLVVICPINALLVWKNEIMKFVITPEEKIHIFKQDYEKFNFESKKFEQISNKKFIITNYDSIEKLDNDNFEFLFNNSHIVFDEIHRIKNSEGVKHKNALSLIKNSYTRTVLTGTPYSTTPNEIYSIFNIAWKESIPTISDEIFQRYSSEINISELREDSIIKLNTLISPYYFKLKKIEDFNIKPSVDNFSNPLVSKDIDIQVRIDEYIFERIQLFSSILKNGPDDKESTLKTLFSYFSRGQINSIDPSLLNSDFKLELSDNIDIDWKECPIFSDLPKIQLAIEHISEYLKREKKIIVWFRYKKNIVRFSELLNKKGIKSVYINGDTNTIEKEKILSLFSNPEDSTYSVLISNPDTIGESISLHKSVFSSLFVEQGFSFYQWAQAKDRIHRVGSPSDKEITHDYIRSNVLRIDSNIYKNLLIKDATNREIFMQDNSNSRDIFPLVENGDKFEKDKIRSFDKYDTEYDI